MILAQLSHFASHTVSSLALFQERADSQLQPHGAVETTWDGWPAPWPSFFSSSRSGLWP